MPIEEEIYLRELGGSVKVLVVLEAADQWQILNPLTRVICSKNDIALKTYATLLEEKEKTLGRNLATLLDEPLFSVRKALADLRRLGLAERERHVRGPLVFDSWYPEKKVLGILRLLPAEYFKKGFPEELIIKEQH